MNIFDLYPIEIIFIPGCLCLCGWLLKSKIEAFPNKLIPFVLLIISCIMTNTLPIHSNGILGNIIFGILLTGFSVGIHSIVKDLRIKQDISKFKKSSNIEEFRISISDIRDIHISFEPKSDNKQLDKHDDVEEG